MEWEIGQDGVMEEKKLREWKGNIREDSHQLDKKGAFYHLFIWNAKAERQIQNISN